jgi:hypothetical protein
MSEATSNNTSGALRLAMMAGITGLIAVALGYFISGGGVPIVGAVLAIPIAIGFAIFVLKSPKTGIFIYLHVSFFVIGLNRFLPPTVPYGLMVDAILGVTLISTLFNAKREDLKRLNNPMFWLVFVWLVYTVLQLINPEARSKQAWFFAVRGVSLYWIQVVPLAFIWLRERKDLHRFIRIWLGWSLVAAFWGFKQQYIGLTSGEVRWLDEGGRVTHVLMGKLRSFSFYSDAGQFGAAMAHTTLFSVILALGEKRIIRKAIYIVIAMICFWGFAVAGSRGPIIVLAGGAFMYLFMVKNFKILALGIMAGAAAFVFLKFTTIGQGNYQIQRMRSALDPNDASLQVRLDNQKKLKAYLATRPLGGGIGSGGNWGQRFTPGTFLAETALDSWYVKIWVETGIIGLWFHIIQLILIVYFGFRKVFFIEDPQLRSQTIGLLCGFFGIALASYGNQIFGQMPTAAVVYLSMVFFYRCDEWDTPALEKAKEEKQEEKKPNLLW